jgi:hypothetical protein
MGVGDDVAGGFQSLIVVIFVAAPLLPRSHFNTPVGSEGYY